MSFFEFSRVFLRDFKLQTTETLRRRVKIRENNMSCDANKKFCCTEIIFCFVFQLVSLVAKTIFLP